MGYRLFASARTTLSVARILSIDNSRLAFYRCGNRVCIRPLLPLHWKVFDMQYRFGDLHYDITCRRTAVKAATSVDPDGVEMDGCIRSS